MTSRVFSVREDGSVDYELPPRVRLSEAFGALCWCATPGVIVSLVARAPWGYATAALAALAALWSIRRVFRIRLRVTKDRVTVDNYWRTYVIPWEDVVAVGMEARFKFPSFAPPPTLAFWRRNRRKVMAQATPRENDRHAFQAAVLALAPRTVENLTQSPQ